eukprot:8698883-Pyramimonas_sp.AAC.1
MERQRQNDQRARAEQAMAQQIQAEQQRGLHVQQQAMAQQLQAEQHRAQVAEQGRLEDIRRRTLQAFQRITPDEREKQLKEFYAMQERQAEEEDRQELRDLAAEYAQMTDNRQQQQAIVTAIIAD